MDEKIFNEPKDLVDWFKQNPDMLAPIPWGGNLVAHYENVGKGCNCKKNIRVENVEKVYANLVIKIFKENSNFAAILKKTTGAKIIKFFLHGKLLAEIQ
tara:strand:+ start:426 stop:722 length:297 start_codon:yes stop_codon:yes gene_type:complete